jgi:hypothetical protein
VETGGREIDARNKRSSHVLYVPARDQNVNIVKWGKEEEKTEDANSCMRTMQSVSRTED